MDALKNQSGAKGLWVNPKAAPDTEELCERPYQLHLAARDPQFGRWMTTEVINGTGIGSTGQCDGLPTRVYDVNDPTAAQTVRLGTVPDPNTVLQVLLTQFIL